MGSVKIPYYIVRRGRGFWQPTLKMRAMGFLPVPCGEDGPDAWRVAHDWNDRWQATRRGLTPAPAAISAAGLSPIESEELTIYPPRSIGAAFRAYRRTSEWARKAPRTREDWWRAWRRIKPVFGDVDPRTVTLAHISGFRAAIEETVSLREAHRVIKIWRALWRVSAALGFCGRDGDPSAGVRNSAPHGRSMAWREGEVVRLAKQAWRAGYRGLAAVIAVAWDSHLSPGDVRALRASQLIGDGAGGVFLTDRAKTGKPVGGMLTARAIRILAAYVAELGVDLHVDAPVFRNRSGSPYSKDTLGDDFRDLRAAVFGATERRTLHDLRRSGAMEAIAGGAAAEHLAHAMGNTLSASNELFRTYVPVNIATISQVHEARLQARRRSQTERTGGKSWNTSAKKV